MEPIEERAIEAGDARRESAIASREFGVDARRLRQAHQGAGEAGVVERRDEAVDGLDAGLAALFEAGDVGELELEGAEVVTRGEMRGGYEIIDVSVAARAERFEALGQIDHFAGQQRIVKRQHRGAVGDRVDAEFEREQHPHEFGEDAFYFEEVLSFLGDFGHRCN